MIVVQSNASDAFPPTVVDAKYINIVPNRAITIPAVHMMMSFQAASTELFLLYKPTEKCQHKGRGFYCHPHDP